MKRKFHSEPVQLADGGPALAADVKATTGIIAIHPPVDGTKGWILTHIASGRVILRARTKLDAARLRKALEALPWGNPEEIRAQVEAIRTEYVQALAAR